MVVGFLKTQGYGLAASGSWTKCESLVQATGEHRCACGSLMLGPECSLQSTEHLEAEITNKLTLHRANSSHRIYIRVHVSLRERYSKRWAWLHGKHLPHSLLQLAHSMLKI